MEIKINNWIPDGFSFDEPYSSIVSKFGEPVSISKYNGQRFSAFYNSINFNFDDGLHLSSIGFGEDANLLINGINPFAEEEKFLALLSGVSSVERFGQLLFPSIGLILENIGSTEEPKSISISSKAEFEKYLRL